MKMLMIATVPSMIGMFNMDNIKMLLNENVEVHVACNFHNLTAWSEEKRKELINTLNTLNVTIHQVDFSRKPTNLLSIIKCVKQLNDLCYKNNFDFIHCHAPICSIITRFVAKKFHIRVIYTAHGFHFYKGAPIINWILYYPLEKYFSRYTDCIVTINEEDYKIASKKFHSKKVIKIPGVGVDVSKITTMSGDFIDNNIYKTKENFTIISVGELNKNKNHIAIIKAIKKLNNNKIKYYICGCGPREDKLKKTIKKYHLEDNVFLLGYVNNVVEFLKKADLFAFPSFREGLGLAAIEAMACGLPLITSNVHGINDYSIDGITGYKCAPNDSKKFAAMIQKLYTSEELRQNISKNNVEFSKKFDKSITNSIMNNLYIDFLDKKE